jgi:hypothetical protein
VAALFPLGLTAKAASATNSQQRVLPMVWLTVPTVSAAAAAAAAVTACRRSRPRRSLCRLRLWLWLRLRRWRWRRRLRSSSDRLINYIKAGIETQYKVTHAPWKKVLGFKFECTESTVTMSAMHTIETMYKTFLQGQLVLRSRSRVISPGSLKLASLSAAHPSSSHGMT